MTLENSQQGLGSQDGRLNDLRMHMDSYVQGIVSAIAQEDTAAEEIFSRRLMEVIIEIEFAKTGIESNGY